MSETDLISRLKEAKQGSRELNAEILEMTGGCAHREKTYYCIEDGNSEDSGFTCNRCGKDTYGEKIPPYTTSIDAAVALIERVLPGWRICFDAVDGVAYDLYLIGPEYRENRPEENSSPPIAGKPTALALCIAVLTALKEQPDDNG